MVRRAYTQRSLVEVLLPDADKLWDPTLRRIDALLDDEVLVDRIADALARRHPQSRRRGRLGTPAAVVLRLPRLLSDRREARAGRQDADPAGIRHRYIRPRRPQQNGKVEWSHRIDQEEFWGRQRFPDFEAAALRGWETRYNYERFSLALQGRTPTEKLAAHQPPRQAA
jgi:transposase InsO family protein